MPRVIMQESFLGREPMRAKASGEKKNIVAWWGFQASMAKEPTSVFPTAPGLLL
jgi:hypothetical protein